MLVFIEVSQKFQDFLSADGVEFLGVESVPENSFSQLRLRPTQRQIIMVQDFNFAHLISQMILDHVRRLFELFIVVISEFAFHELPFKVFVMLEDFACNLFGPSCMYEAIGSEFDSRQKDEFDCLNFCGKHLEEF